jgi:KDO2-lipid IV(A) lauroyltransferase
MLKPASMPVSQRLAHDGLFWRRLASFGARLGPEWWVQYSPYFFGCAAAVAVPSARRAVRDNLRRVRGTNTPTGGLREAFDVARTFTSYAGCLAEVLSNHSKNERRPEATIYGEHHLIEARARGRGLVFATAHTAGWELVGPLLMRDHALSLMMVMEAERDDAARRLHDDARVAQGITIAHVGTDPLAALPLLEHLRGEGVVAIQVDRSPPGMRTRSVTLFGEPARVPEGPFRLAQLAGAPILPIFFARTAYRRYRVHIFRPIELPRRPSEAELDRAAQALADSMASFLRAHPTQWFHFRPS